MTNNGILVGKVMETLCDPLRSVRGKLKCNLEWPKSVTPTAWIWAYSLSVFVGASAHSGAA